MHYGAMTATVARRWDSICGLLAVALIAGCGDDLSTDDQVGDFRISTDSVPDGVVGEEYAVQLDTVNGFEPFIWSQVGGRLPPGLTLSEDGLIAGIPNTTGEFAFLVRVIDVRPRIADSSFIVVVTENPPPVTIAAPQPFPAAQLGVAYSATVSAAGGSGQGYSWRVAQGNLPAGLALAPLEATTSTISGTPSLAGSFDFTLEVQDDLGETASTAVSLEVLP